MPGFKFGVKKHLPTTKEAVRKQFDLTWANVEKLTEEIEAEAHEKWNPAELLSEAVRSLRAVCDGATSDDNVGFAGMHVYHGHRIAKIFSEHDFSEDLPTEIMPEDVEWLRDNLPYYKNTQLSWVPWNQWGEYCEAAMRVASDNQERRDKEEAAEAARLYEEEEKIKKIPYQQARLLFVSIQRTEVECKDLKFLVSLQKQASHSEKQKVWLYKFLAKYWDAVRRGEKDKWLEITQEEEPSMDRRTLIEAISNWEHSVAYDRDVSDEILSEEAQFLLEKCREYLEKMED